MDVLKGYVSDVEFAVPADVSSANFVVKRNGTQVGSAAPAVVASRVAKCTLPYAAVTEEADITVELTFTSASNTYTISKTMYVYTPILPLFEIGKIIESDDEEEQRNVEASVRHIIQAHTGQTFGKFVGKKSITGNGEPFLRLPRRLISFTTVNGSAWWLQTLALRGSGWYLVYKNIGWPTVRADFHGWHENPYTSTVPIMPPEVRKHFMFTANREFEIDGVWGWESVPAQVEEAARLLVNDYACGDSIYRDRFLTSMTAADWRIQFHEGAFSNTGNVRANQLLSGYVLRRGWMVI